MHMCVHLQQVLACHLLMAAASQASALNFISFHFNSDGLQESVPIADIIVSLQNLPFTHQLACAGDFELLQCSTQQRLSAFSWGMCSMHGNLAAGHVLSTPLTWGFQVGFLSIRWTREETVAEWKCCASILLLEVLLAVIHICRYTNFEGSKAGWPA